VGHDEIKIRHLIFHGRRWVWRPTKRMREEGFRRVRLSPGLIINGEQTPAPDDIARANALNNEWDQYRRGLLPVGPRPAYPAGSVGEGYLRALAIRAAEREAKGKVWTSEHHSRDDWPRAWKWIGPVFGDCAPSTVATLDLLALRTKIASEISEHEAYRTIKIWRALWASMARAGMCDPGRDPSDFSNAQPRPRSSIWSEGEAVRLAKQAWRSGYRGLAALLAVSWDSMLSPGDARSLRPMDMKQDRKGPYFHVARAKTGRTALAPLQNRTQRVLAAYVDLMGAEPVRTAQIFRNRSGRAYSKDTLGDDFRAVRIMVFGPGESRTLADFRRSGATEALAGGLSPEKLSKKMGNTLAQSNFLHETYAPMQIASVRDANPARLVGRAKLREQNPDESVQAPDQEFPTVRKGGAK
jgi:integrase